MQCPPDDYWIGLGAPHLTNLKSKIRGDIYIKYGENEIKVNLINAFGRMLSEEIKDSITISDKVAQLLNIKIGTDVMITRKINDEGRLITLTTRGIIPLDKHWSDLTTLGGMEWNYKGKVLAMIVFVDPSENYEVGLSAMFIDNLCKNDTHPYPQIAIQFHDTKLITNIWNAGGMQSVGGYGIRISSKLAMDLGVTKGDLVHLSDLTL